MRALPLEACVQIADHRLFVQEAHQPQYGTRDDDRSEDLSDGERETFTPGQCDSYTKQGTERSNPTKTKTPRAHESRSKMLRVPWRTRGTRYAQGDKQRQAQRAHSSKQKHNPATTAPDSDSHPQRLRALPTSRCCRKATCQTCCPWSCPAATGTCGSRHT